MWCGGQMVKTLGCGWRGEGSNHILYMLHLWHHHDKPHPQNPKQNKNLFLNNIIMGQMCLLGLSIVQFEKN
jgi:hypothetical protein